MSRHELRTLEWIDPDAVYICTRVLDALLREDVRGCVSRGRIVMGEEMDAGTTTAPEQRWLEIAHLGANRLWIPVCAERFMQSWRVSRLPVLAERDGCVTALFEVDEILDCFATEADKDTRARFAAFRGECEAALTHRRAAEAQRREWFSTSPVPEDEPWHQRMQRHDRLASFLDHPLYPTARAKLGFEVGDLARYAPEFAPSFELNWLAVPIELHHARGSALPPNWPGFADVGLPVTLEHDHVLVPVHPFVWQGELQDMLQSAGLADRVSRAPRSWMRVTPTLSVRSLVVSAAPAWHLKLPLTIRTLGAKNIRTIKPSTIADGQSLQDMLAAIVAREPLLRECVLLTREDTGAHVAGNTFLGYIVRRYPEAALQDTTPVPVAALLAATPDGGCVAEELANRFYAGDLRAFLADYSDLTLRLHLTLWVRYGVALESNQQNSVLVLSQTQPRLRLLIKDNDAARLQRGRLARVSPELDTHVAKLEDARITVEEELPLAQMFITITLQLNLAVLVEGLTARRLGLDRAAAYAQVRDRVAAILDELEGTGEDVTLARQTLLDDDWLFLKYLLTAATLQDKSVTGAVDVNKFYGKTARNFLKVAP